PRRVKETPAVLTDPSRNTGSSAYAEDNGAKRGADAVGPEDWSVEIAMKKSIVIVSIILGEMALACYGRNVIRNFAPGWPAGPSGFLFFRMEEVDKPCAERSQKSSFRRAGRECHCRPLLICNGPPERGTHGAQPPPLALLHPEERCRRANRHLIIV